MSQAETVQEWGSAKAAGQRLGVPARKVSELAKKGLLTVRRIPGCTPKYLLSDADRLVQAVTTPAKDGVGPGSSDDVQRTDK